MAEKKEKKEVSRRQFLCYMLGGVGGFLAAGMTAPMVRFALDPALKIGEAGGFVPVGTLDEFDEVPRRVDFILERMDGWYEDKAALSAWVYVKDNEIIALSPICKRLGCTVSWETGQWENEFFCPCHIGRYEKSGLNIPGTPPTAPLDEYEVEIKDGKVYLGPIRPNRVTS